MGKGEKPFRNSTSPSLLPANLLNLKACEGVRPAQSFLLLVTPIDGLLESPHYR
jgi:hypothetical protein